MQRFSLTLVRRARQTLTSPSTTSIRLTRAASTLSGSQGSSLHGLGRGGEGVMTTMHAWGGMADGVAETWTLVTGR